MDELEKFVMDNRGKFDEASPNKNSIWEQVELALDNDSKPSRNGYKWGFWCMVLLLAVVSLIYLFKPMEAESAPKAQELVEIESYYKTLVSNKMQELDIKNVLDVDEKKELKSYLDELDIELEELRNDFEENINNDEVLEAIVANCRERLLVLEDVLERTQTKKYTNNENTISL